MVHRIEFGGKEREDIERLMFTKSVDNLVRPVALVGIAGASVYTSYQLKRWIDSLGNIPDRVEAWFVEKAASMAETTGDVAATIIDPQGKQKEIKGYTVGEQANIFVRFMASKFGINW